MESDTPWVLVAWVLLRTEGCRVEGNICYKDSMDCKWSVALGHCSSGGDSGRQIWAVKVGGRTGRMAVGVARSAKEVSR